ncbi:hypothetical protein [Methanoculleus sp.]|nr:hypothetical protein [Methanoculleus sp.]
MKGIIELHGSDGIDREKKGDKDLTIWIDIQKTLRDPVNGRDAR